MRILVTGAGGFIGWHLVEALRSAGVSVEAWVRRGADGGNAVDITDAKAVAANLGRSAPDVVVHLAGQSSPGASWGDPAGTYRVNVLGAIALLEGARRLKKPPRLLLAGSSAEYAEAAFGRPIAETGLLRPDSPYAASKLAASELAEVYAARHGLDLVRFRPFFLIGPRKTGDACSDFARQIVAVERGRGTVVRCGRREIVRDFLDIRDGVAAILSLIEKGKVGEVYNICSGMGVSIGDVLAGFRRIAGVAFDVEEDPARFRPLDQKVKIGNPGKLAALGWRRRHMIDDALASVLEYWRQAAEQPGREMERSDADRN